MAFWNRKQPKQIQPAPNLRRASTARSRIGDDSIVRQPKSNISEIKINNAFIKDLIDDEWRGVLEQYVGDVDPIQCVVADMAFNSVRILATQAHAGTGAYLSLVTKLKQAHFNIEKEGIGSEDDIRLVYKLNESKSRSLQFNQLSAEDRRNVQLYEDVIAGAYKMKASDVHFEIDPDGAVVRLRIFGRMRKWRLFARTVCEGAVSAGYGSLTKVGTNSGGSFSLDRAMSTMTKHQVDGVTIDGRFSSHPTHNGIDVVVRLLVSDPKRIKIRTLSELGYSDSQITAISDALEKNSGLISIAGSTGSGKSTSLVTFMDIIPRKDELKIVAVEDPVEYPQAGVRKISIQRGPDDPEEIVKRKFNATLRQEMRMDPDVMEIGEIRDRESGSIASEFVMTGHRVLTTIHGDGCVDALARACGQLIQIPEEILAMRKFLAASLYQKLLPTLCSCKVPAKQVLSEQTLSVIENKFALDTSKMFCSNEDGCEHCNIVGIEGSGGTIGQSVCAEVLIPNNAIRDCIARRDWKGVEKIWRSERRTAFDDPDMTGKTAFEHALYKASQGEADIRDVIAEFEKLETYEIFDIKSNVQPLRSAN